MMRRIGMRLLWMLVGVLALLLFELLIIYRMYPTVFSGKQVVQTPASTKQEMPASVITHAAFPSYFSFGTAASAFQVNPYAPGSNWDIWEKKIRSVPEGLATRDAYHEDRLYERDADAALLIGITDHRVSVNWARLEPSPGAWNETEAMHVRAEIRAWTSRGIRVWVCLYHFVEPSWFNWLQRGAPRQFARFAGKVAEQITKPCGVTFIMTMNEPIVPALEGYWKGGYPPGDTSGQETVDAVMRSMAKAHKLAYVRMKNAYAYALLKPMIGVASATNGLAPSSNSDKDALAAWAIKKFYNEYFLDVTEDYQDYIAVTYYRMYKIRVGLGFVAWDEAPNPAEGLRTLLKRMTKYEKPLYVAENGINTLDEKERINYISAHLMAVHQALSEGVDVRGYSIWSLTDTYEWKKGYTTHFGLLGIFRPTQELIWRQSALFYKDLIASRTLTPELVRKHTDPDAATKVRRILPERGITLHIYPGQFDTNGYRQQLDHIKALGANWVSLVVMAFQKCASDTSLSSKEGTPSEGQLTDIVRYAKELDLRVMLKLHIDLTNDTKSWHGDIGSYFTTDADWAAWFASYGDVVERYAKFTDAHGVERYCIGNELVGTTKQETHWRHVIARARAAYHGELAYGSNWGGEEAQIAFWDALDHIGINAYYPLRSFPTGTPSEQDLVNGWKPILEKIESLAERWQKPVLFTEIGYQSIEGATASPAFWYKLFFQNLSMEEQRLAYEAAVSVLPGKSFLWGMHWWEYTGDPENGGVKDGNYLPKGKPAEEVMERWLAETPNPSPAKK